MLNKVILIGNLTRDPEVIELKDGDKLTKFSIAVNRRSGEGVDYFNCSTFGKLAEVCAEYLNKGSKVAVIGSLQLDVVEYEDDTKRTFLNVNVAEVEFLGGNKRNEENEPEKPTKKAVKRK